MRVRYVRRSTEHEVEAGAGSTRNTERCPARRSPPLGRDTPPSRAREGPVSLCMVFTSVVTEESERASAGSIGGSSVDRAVEYQRSVAAYAVAFGLASVPVAGFGPEPAVVRRVWLETNEPVDDIRIEFVSGGVSYVQAKSALSAGKPLDAALGQWAEAARRGLEVGKDHLVVVTGSISGVARHLGDVLALFKAEHPGKPANREQEKALRLLDKHLSGLSAEQRDAVRRCASIQVLSLGNGANHARSALVHVVPPTDTNKAWRALVEAVGRTTRIRGGHGMASWLEELRRSPEVAVTPSAGTAAAWLEQREGAICRHADGLRARRDTVDLRVLGAEVRPISLAAIDAGVKVVHQDGDDREGLRLLWAFLRHGRSVLTGLPGSGKSHAVATLAADLMDDDPHTLVVVARLADVDGLDRRAKFANRLIEAALRDADVRDQTHLSEEIVERLGDGRIVLLLDGLDETYERRGAVVAELAAFLGTISDDVEVLLSTRDVGYGHAATLGWEALRMTPPRDVGRTVHAVLDAYAEQRFPMTDANDVARTTWRTTREGWVTRALDGSGTLRETPLLAVLLATLAAERDEETFPRRRADILGSVIDDVVRRHENRRDPPLVIGNLGGSDAAHAILAGFETEATVLLDHDTTCSSSDVVSAVSEMLSHEYGMPSGLASAGAKTVVRVWDESGIFVISGGAQVVSPRLMLFAEIGDARAATRLDPEAVPSWIADRIARGRLESVVLAAGLSSAIATAFAEYAAAETTDRDILHAFWKAVGQGAQPATYAAHSACRTLIRDTIPGDHEAWQSWTTLANAPRNLVAADLPALLRSFGPAHQSIGRAFIALRTTPRAQLVEEPEDLLGALRVALLPRLTRRVTEPKVDRRGKVFSIGTIDRTFVDVITEAAEVVVGSVAGAEALVVAQLEQAPQQMKGRLASVLKRRGFAEIIPEDVKGRALFTKIASTIERFDFDADGPDRLLYLLADAEPADLTRRQSRRLDELADLLETLDVNSTGSFHFRKQQKEDQRAVVTIVSVLGGFEEPVVAAQARIVQRRMSSAKLQSESMWSEPMWSLLHGASRREFDPRRWDVVSDPDSAVTLLVEMLAWSVDDAYVAGRALWAAPPADCAAPAIRELMSNLEPSPQHLRVAAHVLASFGSTPEPHGWDDHYDPVLRAVAAECCEPIDVSGRASGQLVRFLEDVDGHVREAAIKVLAESEALDRDELLQKTAKTPDPGWTCMRCRTPNLSGSRWCSGTDETPCGAEGPAPAELASLRNASLHL